MNKILPFLMCFSLVLTTVCATASTGKHLRPELTLEQEKTWLNSLIERSPHRLALQLAKHSSALVDDLLGQGPMAPPAKTAKEALTPKTGRRLYGYLPYWTIKNTKLHWKQLTQLSWFCAELESNGSFSSLHGWGSADAKALIAQAHSHGVQVTLTVTLFSTSGIHKVIETATKRTQLIKKIVDLVINGGGDGVNIDFEGLAKADRDNMKAFIIELNKTMKNKLPGADVTLATPAVDWSGAWDYDVLAENSDGLMVMAYGLHWTGGSPGPQLPMGTGKPWTHKTLEWVVDDYVKYGKAENIDKFIIGLPLYGDSWPSSSDQPGAKQSAKGKAVTYEKAKIEAPTKSGWKWEPISQSSYYTYKVGGQWYQTWVDNPQAFNLRVKYLDKRDTQMGLWALGYADKSTEVWKDIDWFMDQGSKAAPGADAGSTTDAGGSTDAGATGDVGQADTGAPDTGAPDTGSPDTGAPDTGSPDT
ncbi:MAG TPA: hypothetical protein DCQ06_10265, partial [Myxococcales bacterium]|nr:hypothetical protein [Myxococcales bacterium]